MSNLKAPLTAAAKTAQLAQRVQALLLDTAMCYATEPPTLDFSLPGLLMGTVGLLVSPGGAGKSIYALQAAHAIAAGKDMLDLSHTAGGPIKTGGVLMLAGEDPGEILHTRLHAIGARLNLEQRTLAGQNLRIMKLAGEAPDLMNADWLEVIEFAVTMQPTRLIVLDTLRRFHTLEECDSGEMAMLLGRIEALCKHTGAAALLLHHTNKLSYTSGNSDAQQAARGSSVLTDNVRCQMNLAVMSKDEADEFGIEAEDRKSYIRVIYSKHNYCAPIQDRWYRRTQHGLFEPATLTPKVKDEGKGKGRGASIGGYYGDKDW